jgi:hypothetical protein
VKTQQHGRVGKPKPTFRREQGIRTYKAMQKHIAKARREASREVIAMAVQHINESRTLKQAASRVAGMTKMFDA